MHHSCEGGDEKALCIELGNEVGASWHDSSCVNCFSVAMIKYRETKGNLKKKSFIWAYSCRGRIHTVGRHCSG